MLKKGLGLSLTCSEACGARISLELTGAFRSAARPVVIGRRTLSLPAAPSVRTLVKLNAAGKKALKRVRKPKVVVRIAVSDAAGNSRTVTRSVTLKR